MQRWLKFERNLACYPGFRVPVRDHNLGSQVGDGSVQVKSVFVDDRFDGSRYQIANRPAAGHSLTYLASGYVNAGDPDGRKDHRLDLRRRVNAGPGNQDDAGETGHFLGLMPTGQIAYLIGAK